MFPWTCPVEEVVVPCAGRLQPEHVLKAFEAGADLVCVIACEEDNCHFLEGSCRATHRIEYIQTLLDEVGLDGRRLMIFHLPGSAREDMALGASSISKHQVSPISSDELSRQIADIAAQVAGRLKMLPPSPLHKLGNAGEEVEISEVEEAEENDE